MTVRRYAILDGEEVVNIILWDSSDEYTASEGCTTKLAPAQVGIGWLRVDNKWVAPPTPELEEPEPPIEDPEVAAAKQVALQELKDSGVSEPTARLILGL